ncbi:hypothetical protein E6H32_06825 [Candidatus Bathyarchaeota archaeon]|nr:MAG: hypothetical protein E6H32_06825 [Candidatus Bathyarchaeota archaeon]
MRWGDLTATTRALLVISVLYYVAILLLSTTQECYPTPSFASGGCGPLVSEWWYLPGLAIVLAGLYGIAKVLREIHPKPA